MAPAINSTPIFKKKLKNSDLLHRLSVPTRSLPDLPGFGPGENHMSFPVVDEESGAWFNFHCYKRKKGDYSKPIFSKGYLDFARRKRLRVGDEVFLYKMEAPGFGEWFQISAFRRSFRLFGVNINVD